MKPRRRMPRLCRRFVARAIVYGAEALILAGAAAALGNYLGSAS